VVSDVVGPICESGDYFGKDRKLPKVEQGDYLALLSAGAYGSVMCSNYNSRPLAAEVLVKGRRSAVVRKRQPMPKIWEGEQFATWQQQRTRQPGSVAGARLPRGLRGRFPE
jgi:diaminopimelate decarboxylase